MSRLGSKQWWIGAAALLAVVFVCGWYWHKKSASVIELQTSGNQSIEMMKSEPMTQSVADMVTVEINGEIQSVSLPDGIQSPLNQTEEPPSRVWNESYQGLDPALQKPDAPFFWFERSIGEMIYGRMVSPYGRDMAPLYACDTVQHVCKNTGSSVETSPGEIATVPQGAFSPSGAKIALVNHHDTPYIETGLKWDLILYNAQDLSQPTQTLDISAVIDQSPEIGYDSVSSVAWSPDERRIAIGTARSISVVDVQSGVISRVFETALLADDEDYPFWDSSALSWSPSGRYLVFAYFSPAAGNFADDDEEMADMLQSIDLEQGNHITTLVQGAKIRLVTAD